MANRKTSVGRLRRRLQDKQRPKRVPQERLAKVDEIITEGKAPPAKKEKAPKAKASIWENPKKNKGPGFFKRVTSTKWAMKLLHNRASQLISALAGLVVGKLVSAGVLEYLEQNDAVRQFVIDIGITPTEAGIVGLITGIFWSLYNLIMTWMYGAKFKRVQIANDLAPDRWAGPKTMDKLTNKN